MCLYFDISLHKKGWEIIHRCAREGCHSRSAPILYRGYEQVIDIQLQEKRKIVQTNGAVMEENSKTDPVFINKELIQLLIRNQLFSSLGKSSSNIHYMIFSE